MSNAIPKDKCIKCYRDKDYSVFHDRHVCPVCDVEWDPELWDMLRENGMSIIEWNRQ